MDSRGMFGMNRTEIKAFAVWKCAKIAAVVLTIFTGLFVWPIWIYSRVASAWFHHGPHPPFSVFLVFPVFYGVCTFFMTAIMCWLYNVLSPRIGRIEIELGDSPSNELIDG